MFSGVYLTRKTFFLRDIRQTLTPVKSDVDVVGEHQVIVPIKASDPRIRAYRIEDRVCIRAAIAGRRALREHKLSPRGDGKEEDVGDIHLD